VLIVLEFARRTPRIRGVTWTRDGSTFIIGKHDSTSDIVLLDQTR
jgi:hypothetical protein